MTRLTGLTNPVAGTANWRMVDATATDFAQGAFDAARDAVDDVLVAVGPRLRALRRRRGTTLGQLSEATGISVSTLSRLESGRRRPTLELLLLLARAHQVQLDELVD